MPRNITVTFSDGSTHIYRNAPDGVTPEQVSARAAKQFGKSVSALDGGRGAAPAPAKGPKPQAGAAPRGTSVDDNLLRFQALKAEDARKAYANARQGLIRNVTDPAKQKVALARFDSDPRMQAIRQIAGFQPVTTRRGELQDVARRAKEARSDFVTQTGKKAGQDKGATDFGAGLRSGYLRSFFGLPERAIAAKIYYAGNPGNFSHDEVLQAVRAAADQEMSRSTAGNVTGQLGGAFASGGAVTKVVGGGARLLSSGSRPGLAKAGNYLQGLMTVRKGERVRNVGKVALAGAAGGAAQAAGEGSDISEGAAYGAAAPLVLGGAIKVARQGNRLVRTATRPFSKSDSKAIREIIEESPDAIKARQIELSNQVGEEVPVIAALKENDFREVANRVVRRSPEAEEVAKTHTGKYLRGFMDRMLRHVNNAGRSGDAQITSIGELAQMQKDTADDLMRPIRDRTMDLTQLPLDDLERQVAKEIGSRIKGLAPRIRDAFNDLDPNELGKLGLDASDLAAARRLMSDWGFGKPVQATVQEMDSLRRALNAAAKSSQNTNPANAMAYRNAAQIVREFVEKEVPEYGQMVDTYAAQARMMEGFETAAAGTRVSDISDNQLRSNLQTPEGRVGMKAGELFRQREMVSAKPTSAINAARNYAAEGNLTRQASIDPGAAPPGTITENLGEAPAAGLAKASQGETQVLDRMLDTDKLNAMAQWEQGVISPEQIAYGALLGNAMATTKARFALSIVKSITGDPRATPINPQVATNIAEMLYSQDPAQITKAMAALNKVGLTEAAVTTLMRNAVPASVATGALVGGESDPDAGAPSGDVPSVEGDLMGGEGPSVEGDLMGMEEEVAEGDSQYSAMLQEVYDNENPELLDLIDRVAQQESQGQQLDANGNPITSSAGAIGIMQVMPQTAPEAAQLAGLPWDEEAYYNDESYNKLLGIAYLSEMLRRYDGDVELALIAYNAGPARADAFAGGTGGLPAETQDYIARIM
jgi:Transglycosylase SLT domain